MQIRVCLFAGALSVGAFLSTAAAQAQQAAPRDGSDSPESATQGDESVAVFVNPLGLLYGVFNGDLDFALRSDLTLNLSGAYYNIGDTSAFGVGVGVQYFFASNRRPFHGWYVYPALNYAKAEAKSSDTRAEASLVGVSATIGYQWNWQPFALRLGLGAGYFAAVARGESDGESESVSLEGVLPRLDASIGLTF